MENLNFILLGFLIVFGIQGLIVCSFLYHFLKVSNHIANDFDYMSRVIGQIQQDNENALKARENWIPRIENDYTLNEMEEILSTGAIANCPSTPPGCTSPPPPKPWKCSHCQKEVKIIGIDNKTKRQFCLECGPEDESGKEFEVFSDQQPFIRKRRIPLCSKCKKAPGIIPFGWTEKGQPLIYCDNCGNPTPPDNNSYEMEA